MGREVRRVPADWAHPKHLGNYTPLHGGSFAADLARWELGAAKWAEGLRDDFDGGWQPREPDELSMPFSEWDGDRPDAADYMPDWPASERTHWQMYEDTTEGTPISPVMATPEELARWLADTGASAFGYEGASYESWLATIRRGSALGLLVQNGVATNGVEWNGRKP